MKKINKISIQSEVTVEGLMTLGKSEKGLRTLDFMCCDDAQVEPMVAQCKVQLMRDGNVYITELPKRVHNKALYRDDNSSLTLGRNGRFYFIFTMDQEDVGVLPHQLVRQASTIAQKVLREILNE